MNSVWFKRLTKKVLKIFCLTWWPVGVLLLLGSFYMLTHQDGINSYEEDNLNSILEPDPSLVNSYHIDISKNIGEICDGVKDRIYNLFKYLLWIIVGTDGIIWFRQFVKHPENRQTLQYIIDGCKNGFITCFTLITIYYVYMYANL